MKKKYKTDLSGSFVNRSYERGSGSKGRLLSPQLKSKNDYSILLENEIIKNSNMYKNQNEYLKKIIYSLDMKLKVKFLLYVNMMFNDYRIIAALGKKMNY